MAELSTLSPSPPTLGDAHAAPSSSGAPEAPKSSLYNDKGLAGVGSSLQLPQSPPTPPAEPLAPPKVLGAAPLPEELMGCETEIGAHVVPEITGCDVSAAESQNPEKQNPEKQNPETPTPPDELLAPQAFSSPDMNLTPNLYPSVHVSQNPSPVPDEAPAAAAVQTQTTPSGSGWTEEKKEEKEKLPQNPLQNPHCEPPPVSPKSNPEAWKADLLTTPPRAEQPSPVVPLIHEPLPNPSPRPAPDTLSYLESASLMSGTLESLSGLGEDGSSVGSDSEINGLTVRRTDKYGFLGGNQYRDSGDKEVRVEVARQREMKWLDMFVNWDKWIKHRFQKVKLRCRKGVPSSLRAKAWQLLSNSQDLLLSNPGKFEELEREQGEAKWLDIIEKDLHRQFPFHEMFAARGGHGQQDLYRILKAYTIYRPDEGYCQAQAPVAAVLLMHMPAEQAFWCLVQICEKYLPGYYSAGLEAIQLDGEIFFSLLRRTCPMAYRHLKKFKIDPILYMTEWFMCIFSRTLPWACVLRVWDMFFCEGVKIVFRVGLVLLKQMLGSVEKLRELQGMYETMERLRNISPDMIREDNLAQEVITLQVTEALIERECSVQVRKWRESRGELTHQPGRRLHGTRAIYEHKRRAAAITSGGSFSFLGSPAPPPGPLRASSSLLSLPGFRKSKAPFHSQPKKGSFSGPSSATEAPPTHFSPAGAASGLGQGPGHKPPIPPGAAQRAQVQSPLAGGAGSPAPPPSALSPSPVVVSERITPTIPSPTANNAPLAPCPDAKKEASPTPPPGNAEEDGKKKKRSKEEKKKEKDDEKKKQKEKKEKEKVEKERLRKEKERLEKEKKKGGKKKEKGGGGGGEAEDKNGAAATGKDSA